MKENKPYRKPSRFNKGFYISLGICVVAIGAVAAVTVLGTRSLRQTKPNSSASTTQSEKQVDRNVTGRLDPVTTTTASTTTPTTKAKEVVASAEELYVLPLTNEVSQRFSNKELVYSVTMQDWRVHNGTDFTGAKGQAVKAVSDGTIRSIENDAFWGPVVTIDHGHGVIARYCGVKASVKVKQEVKVGEVIGKLDEIPCEAQQPSHLHLEILVKDQYANPVDVLGRDVKYATTAAGTTTTAGKTTASGTTKTTKK